MSALGEVEQVSAVLRRAHTLLEGPRVGPGDELVYSDVIAGGLFSCSPQGQVSVLLERRRGIGGVMPHAAGGWVISGRSVIHLQRDGSQRELLAQDGACGYNDLFATASGDLLAGELRYRPMAGEEPRDGRILQLTPGGEVRTLTESVTWPNGIGVSPDGATVYVSDYARALVLAIPLQGAAERVLFHSPRGSADGLAVDSEGFVWVALGEGGGVARVHPGGEVSEVIDLPAQFVSSISFGGADMRDVLITTADNPVDAELGGTVLRARSTVAGAPVPAVRA